MNRILQPIENEVIGRISRLQNNNDALALIGVIKQAKAVLDSKWHLIPRDDIDKYQGACQVLSEIIDLFDNAETFKRGGYGKD